VRRNHGEERVLDRKVKEEKEDSLLLTGLAKEGRGLLS